MNQILNHNYKGRFITVSVPKINNNKILYRNILKNYSIILNIDLFILIFYQFNDKKQFNEWFNRIESKIKVTEYIISHPEIFKLDCSNLECLFENRGKIELHKIISLATNFNEYINFF